MSFLKKEHCWHVHVQSLNIGLNSTIGPKFMVPVLYFHFCNRFDKKGEITELDEF